MKKKYSLILFLAVLSFTACNNSSEEKNIDNTAAIPVNVSSVAAENNTPFLTASGKIEAANSATLSTRMMGFVDKVHVNVGEKVTKGQLLVSINNSDLSAKSAQTSAGITEAQAAFNNAEKDYQRFKNLFAENSASQKELDDQRARYEMAKARLEGAKQMKNEVQSQFAYVNLRAPFSGVVTNKFIEAGDMANPGVPLISVEGPGNFEVTASVPESEISKIKSGTEVQVIVKSSDKILPGTVTEVSTSAKNTGGQYLVKVVLDKTDADILSGMYATVQFPIERKADITTILVPKEAIVKRGQLTGIYTVSQSNTALLRWLRVGRTFGDNVEVLSGLAADENYIISSEGKLYNGAKITIKQ
ncbi:MULTISPECIES: efflux RND transporter periplasmic adaptor subunit [Aequorivita]|uniref:Efflux RND transporter periplasmic adaptor subunit n=1 Tax=Aequorivita iocasae TaxID=2803865 RepID=A0ABX7DQB1_9FLAO|nr:MULTISPECIES: efflux RND transporter periplasmic adaptor subunit [Aequorivita]QQX75781.1 efflux RND transporter periplasmic adaptor subunit [Aequorivita iocasae]UCA55241.1 efflux RND transporter periplasmic adaptor subunit [Aequorivita sp. F7]